MSMTSGHPYPGHNPHALPAPQPESVEEPEVPVPVEAAVPQATVEGLSPEEDPNR